MTNQIQYPYPVKKIAIHNQIEMAYMDEGKGTQTLLFIHGLANYAPVWKSQIEALKNDYRCIAVDLPGNGLSSSGDFPYSQFFYAESIKQFVDALGIDQAILVGHSMGGQISLMLALRYPSIFQKLVLIAPAGIEYFSPTDKLIMQNLLTMGDFFYSDELHLESAIKEGFTSQHETAKSIINDLKSILKIHKGNAWRQMALASIKGMLNEQINQFLPAVSAKTILIFGKNDALIPNKILHPTDSSEKIAMQGAALLPNATMHMIPQANHFVFIEQSELVNKLLKDWLGE